MAEGSIVQIKAEPLPTKEEMIARKTMVAMTLNDYVDQVHMELYGSDQKYTKLLDAVYDEDAVEGALSIDNMLAADMIRQYAKRHEIGYLTAKKLATIVKSLNVVLRRYHISRKERADRVRGESVTNAPTGRQGTFEDR